MPPRRSSRAASTKPTSKAPTATTATTKKVAEKRAASPEPAAPPAKRSRSVKKDSEEETEVEAPKPQVRASSRTRTATTKAAPTATKEMKTTKAKAASEAKPRANGATSKSKAATESTGKEKAPKKPTVPKKDVIIEPAINALATAPDHTRPCPQLWGCGAGNFGQLGMGPDYLDEYPKLKRNLLVQAKIDAGEYGGEGAGLEAIAAGGMHTLFVDEAGKVWSCGVNDEGALGRITSNVPNPSAEGKFLDVDELTAVPHPVQTLLDENFRAVKVVAGDNISGAISDVGELRVWGSFRANQGSLGFSGDAQHQFLPVAILDLSRTQRGQEPEKVVSFASGNNHLLVLTNHGNIYALGAGEEGQLGRRVLERRKIHGTNPEKVVLGARGRKAVVVGAGNNHSFAVDEAGDTWAWGLNSKGQTGTGVSDIKTDGEVHSPARVRNLSKEELGGVAITEIAGGDHHTLFLSSDGRVFACGRSEDGQLGLPDSHPAFADRTFEDFLPEPVQITFPDMNDRIVNISAGTHGNMAVSAEGVLYAWGAQAQGELGLGDESGAKTPTVVVRKTGQWAAVKASCGGQHSVVLLKKRETEDD